MTSNWSARWDDARFARLYDQLYPAEAKTAFFVGLAHEASVSIGRADPPITILDLGCGTGRLACELARHGHRVTGADPAPVMLDVARQRPGAGAVTWIEANAADLSLDARFDLIVMTGHVFQVFLEDDQIAAVLGNIRRHLHDGGRLAFETRNPEARIWDEWAPEEPRHCQTAEFGVVASHREVESVVGEIVTYKHHFQVGDERRVNSNRIRFVSQEKLGAFLAATGYTDVIWYGDWDRTPVAPNRPELVVVAE